MKTSAASLLLAVLLSLLACTARAAADLPPAIFPADSLHIIVTIDGSDDLHISQRSAAWVHKTWGQPSNISINGYSWDSQQLPILSSDRGLLASNLDLSGAVLHVLRGRGSVELGRDADGLVIHFDDPQSGADTYEVGVLFAQRLAHPSATTQPLELRINAMIDDTDEIWFARDQANWVHTGGSPPVVAANSLPWDVIKNPKLVLQSPLDPEVMDLQRANLIRMHGRGIVNLEYRPELLCLDFEDRGTGADQYDLLVQVPRFGDRHLVRIKANASTALLGAALKIYRLPAAGPDYAALPGQRVFDARGQCLVALESGRYQFEVQHRPGPQTLVALKTSVLDISGPTTVDLNAVRVQPRLFGPDRQAFALDELAVRSTQPCGAVDWKSPGPNSPAPTLLLSRDQTYMIHAFGHSSRDYAAVWTTLKSAELEKITLKQEQWRSCDFHWNSGSPKASSKGVVLQFPDGKLDVLNPEKARVFTNRRFFTVAYWLAFDGDCRAIFQPRGFVLPEAGVGEVVLGGPLRPLASAAVLQDENLGVAGAQHLWWEILLADSQNYLLDTNASKIDWQPTLAMIDGNPAVTAPLSPSDVQRLGNLKDTLIAGASYRMGTKTAEHISVHPDVFVSRQTTRFVTQVPSYREWNTCAYLAKMARELDMIALARQQPLPAGLRFNVSSWLNTGAVGGNYSVTMPFPTYLDCDDWFRHPWAIAHEMLHSFGYGHAHEMDRLDREVQQRMAAFQWQTADQPDYVPEELQNGQGASVR